MRTLIGTQLASVGGPDTMRPRSTLPDILLAVFIGVALAFVIAYNI